MGKYKPAPVRRVEIPKDNGKTRKLGIPTAVDRVIQQAIAQVLGPLSPLLSNIVLNGLDKELERRGHPFVRYADDSLIFCRSRRGAEIVSKGITKFIEKKLHLKVNREKTEVGTARKMKFLGYSFYKTGEG